MLKPENIDYHLGARILSGEATAEDLIQHEQWLAADPMHHHEWEEMVQSWHAASDALRYQQVDVDAGWASVIKQVRAGKEKRSWYALPVFRGVAATITVLLAVAAAFWLFTPQESIVYEKVVVSSLYGEEVTLPDGSVVTLSSESSISYLKPFKPDQRLVQFSGEAFFQVEGNPSWPFVIETDDITIKVTGTSFNVRARPDQKASFVDVSSGRVEVSSKKASAPLMVTPGLRAVYTRSNGKLEKLTADPNFLSWKTRELKFQDVPLSQVFETLENVYQVEIQVSDASILNERMGATFSHNTFDYISGVVCATFDLKCVQQDEGWMFSRK